MSDLVVLDFDGVGTADEVLTKLRGLQKEHLIDLEDACVVVHTEAGKVQVKQAVNLTAARRRQRRQHGHADRSARGPAAAQPARRNGGGRACRRGLGRLVGIACRLRHQRRVHQEPRQDHPEGLLRIVHLIKSSTPDKVLPEIERFKPRVLKTSLSREQEDKLRAALSATAKAA